MQTRRDQVQAQSYMAGRLVAALVTAEPDGIEHPHRRTLVGTFCGVLVAILVMAGFLVFGFFSPGGAKSWRAAGTLIVDRDTGSRYLLVDNRLRPVLNYASARLLLGEPPTVKTVSGKSLRGVAHGSPLGIVGAPDTLPPSGSIDGRAWTVCAEANRDQAGVLSIATTLSITPPDHRQGTSLSPDHALVAQTPGGDRYLVWRGHRLRLTRTWLDRVLGVEASLITVGSGWLETLPVGPDVAPVAVPGRGALGAVVDGRRARVGELFEAGGEGAAARGFVLQRDGLRELTPTAYAIALADPDTAHAYPAKRVVPTRLSLAALASVPIARRPDTSAEVPDQLPMPVANAAGTVWCLRLLPGADVPEVTTGQMAPPSSRVRDALAVNRTARTADAVVVAPGTGGLVAAGRAGQAPGPVLYLITDAGVKFPLTETASRLLGYAPGSESTVPRRLLDMLPTGPLLDPAAAGG
ncbi:type VII secretion protein EccB [Micromonospora lupini]|uniref:type VII secretion protein EccB n=1 Tax=Micromonospora lupini TaxID=285679 RepID=UPI0031CEA1ED